MKNNKKLNKIIICIAPFAVALILFAIAFFVNKYIKMPECYIHKFTGLYCPSCGITRSIVALIHGDILMSLRQNAMVVFLIICALLLYVEVIFKAFGKQVRSPIRNYYFLYVSIILFAIYCVARNFIPQIAPI